MDQITVEAVINKNIEQVWMAWNGPEHITQWAFASDDWECPSAENDLQVGGRFITKMAAKDGTVAFDFSGSYTQIIPGQRIEYNTDDSRKVAVVFEQIDDNTTKLIESFDPENINPLEMQRAGWQAILDNFKRYVESI